MSGEFMTRRISAAMDLPDGLESPLNAKLREELEREPASKKWAADAQTLDALLHGWPEAERSEEAWEGLAARIEQRLTEALPGGLDFTTPPFFDDEDARAGRPEPSSGRVRTDAARREIETKRAEFSLSQLSQLDSPKHAVPPPPPHAGNPRLEIAPAVPPSKSVPQKLVPHHLGEERVEIPTFAVPIKPLAPLAPPPLAVAEPKRRNWLLLGGGGLAAAAVVLVAVFVVRGLSSEQAEVAASAVALPMAAAPSEPAAPSLAPPVASPTDLVAPMAPTAVTAAPAEAPSGAMGGAGGIAPAPSPAAGGDRPAAVTVPAGGASAARVRGVAAGPGRAPGTGDRLGPRAVAGSAAENGVTAASRRPPAATGSPTPASAVRPGGGAGGGGAAPMQPRGGGAAAAPAGPAPDAPSRGDIMAAMASVRPAVNACAQGVGGVAQVRVTFSGSSGRVTSAMVEGQFAGTPQGSCIARAVRGASVPRFTQPTFSVLFPFQI
jgi:hypothetical protein